MKIGQPHVIALSLKKKPQKERLFKQACTTKVICLANTSTCVSCGFSRERNANHRITLHVINQPVFPYLSLQQSPNTLHITFSKKKKRELTWNLLSDSSFFLLTTHNKQQPPGRYSTLQQQQTLVIGERPARNGSRIGSDVTHLHSTARHDSEWTASANSARSLAAVYTV